MDCKCKDSLVPRCEIVTHPDRPNVEYCKLCREWDYLNQVGNFSPASIDFLWLFIAAGLIVFLLQARPSEESPSYSVPERSATSAERSLNRSRRNCLAPYCNN
jgi:hypothetical protein